MVGMFAVSEVLRYAVNITKESGDFTGSIDKVFSGTLKLVAKYPKSIMRGSVLGTVVGALPGAGADIASYVLCDQQEVFQGARKIRHRSPRRHSPGQFSKQ